MNVGITLRTRVEDNIGFLLHVGRNKTAPGRRTGSAAGLPAGSFSSSAVGARCVFRRRLAGRVQRAGGLDAASFLNWRMSVYSGGGHYAYISPAASSLGEKNRHVARGSSRGRAFFLHRGVRGLSWMAHYYRSHTAPNDLFNSRLFFLYRGCIWHDPLPTDGTRWAVATGHRRAVGCSTSMRCSHDFALFLYCICLAAACRPAAKY